MKWKEAYSILKDTGNQWLEDKAPTLGAALAYYSVFSITPLLLLAIGIAGFVFGHEAAQSGILNEIQGTVGEPVAGAVRDVLEPAQHQNGRTLATVLGIATLLLGASGVFGQLQDALNTIWKVEPKPGRGILGFIRDRFFSITMVLGTGFLLLVSLIITATLSAVSKFWTPAGFPGGTALWEVINNLVSIGFITVLFALIFRFVPNVRFGWRDVWMGAALSAFLFVIGKYALGEYLGRSGVTSTYGAAGSLVVVVLWVYYSAQILLFGAEFTRVVATRYGKGIRPTPNAVSVSPESQSRQGTAQPARVGA
jgi:membrane protein